MVISLWVRGFPPEAHETRRNIKPQMGICTMLVEGVAYRGTPLNLYANSMEDPHEMRLFLHPSRIRKMSPSQLEIWRKLYCVQSVPGIWLADKIRPHRRGIVVVYDKEIGSKGFVAYITRFLPEGSSYPFELEWMKSAKAVWRDDRCFNRFDIHRDGLYYAQSAFMGKKVKYYIHVDAGQVCGVCDAIGVAESWHRLYCYGELLNGIDDADAL
jgi:hypothetical protein